MPSSKAVLLLLLLFAAAVRLARLGEPEALVFDETYYAKDACIYLELGKERCGLNQDFEQTYVHPPTGKWLIAAGIKIFDYTPFGRRFMAAIFGVGLVLVVYLLAGRLFRNRWVSIVASLFVATDFLLLVQSRIAMLDIFLAFFVVLGFVFVAMDRERVAAIKDQLSTGEPARAIRRGLANRLLAGASLGVALSVKWSAIYALIAAALLCLSWSYGLEKLRRKIDPNRAVGGFSDAVVGLMLASLAFVVVPAGVYLASYADFYGRLSQQECAYTVPDRTQKRFFGEGFNGRVAGECVTGISGMAMNLGDLHIRMAEYHLTLKATHLYQSKAWSWPLVLRPVAYHWEWRPDAEGAPNRQASHIVAMGNVVTWYGSLVAGVWLLVRSVKKWRPESVVAAAWAAQYVPWLLVDRPLFFFYMTPVVPFMMIGLAAALNTLRTKRAGRWGVNTFFVVALVVFVLFFPVLTAIDTPYDLWKMLMWVPSFDCGGLKCGWI
jgi:dolichyl-phosphate-mannose--protein O-mannosyl transferase